jgi:hypothetical protein
MPQGDFLACLSTANFAGAMNAPMPKGIFPEMKRALIVAAGLLAVTILSAPAMLDLIGVSISVGQPPTPPLMTSNDAYRLVHVVGGKETVVAKGLNRFDCFRDKALRQMEFTLGTGESVICKQEPK